jgi:phosphohistidine swiveling domain-containing protein
MTKRTLTKIHLTKAESLEYIKKNKIKKIYIPKFFFFRKIDFTTNPNTIIKKIIFSFKKDIIIRSSSISEDTHKKSNAGKFESRIVKLKEFTNLLQILREFSLQFKNNKDQILIQELIKNVEISGVIFNKDPQTGFPYYIINYDETGKTDLITAGIKNPKIKTLIIYKKKINSSKKFKTYLKILQELEKIYYTNNIDIEFAVKNKKFYLFQCRPLVVKKNKKIKNLNLDDVLINLKKKIDKISLNQILSGTKTIYSNMADWNPAEMIGSKPYPLSASLYSELITDKVWALQRNNYGYKNVEPYPLMFNFLNATYVDIRTDLNSFLPKNLNDNIEKKIINNSIEKLSKKPFLHDKIEFEIINTCYDFDIKRKLSFLNKKEKKIYIDKLKALTNEILKNYKSILKLEINKIKFLEYQIQLYNIKKISHIEKIYLLIEALKKNGTLPFAGIARCAFISTVFLKSLLKKNLISNNDYKNFFKSINTVSRDIHKLSERAKVNMQAKKTFLKKYGHIRPSTYSISSLSYKENFKDYFGEKSYKKIKVKSKFTLSNNKIDKINSLLKKHKIKISAKNLFNFSKESIRQRELSKSIFTKAIDEIFISLIKLGKEINVSRKDLEYISIKTIIKHYAYLDANKLKKIIKDEIKKNKINYKKTENIKLPDIILKSNDIYSHYLILNNGNFITKEKLLNEIIYLNNKTNFRELNQKIVFVENADPGFDFLFSYNIKGLVTKYGGANSHMAIRCLEENIPACIGIGERKFNFFKNSKKIELDCKQKTLKLIN